MINNFYRRKGFTLVETLVAVSIFTFISFAIALFQKDLFSFGSNVQSNLSAQIEARGVLRTIVSEIRSISPSSLGSYPIESAGTSTIVFFSDEDGDGLKERIRYYLDGDSIKRGVIKPSTNPVSYSGSEDISTVIRDVVNGTSTPVFQYFASGYVGTSTPLVSPIDVVSVRYIKIRVEVDSDINKPPREVVSETGVTLRNLKDNL